MVMPMTEKRFTSNNGVFYTDNYTGWEFQSYGEVVNLLNNLNDENQQLRKLIEKNKTRTDKAIKELVDTNVYLKKENEQLKQENANKQEYIQLLELKLAKNGIRLEPKDFD